MNGSYAQARKVSEQLLEQSGVPHEAGLTEQLSNSCNYQIGSSRNRSAELLVIAVQS